MKTDSKLRDDVIQELSWDPRVNEKEIAVAVKDGVVTIAGTIPSYAQKYAAERAVERVNGVRAVANDLTVKVASVRERTDTQIAHAAVSALEWDDEVPSDAVKVQVENGWVRLEGSLEWQYQKNACERAVRYLTGVKGVSNMITIKPKRASTVEVSQKIKDALRRAAESDADRITVESSDGRVTLKGAVRTWAERADAEHAAWAAPGVTAVDDRITIRP
jgi:osmotically-inducible protein OsmY